jgi:hypothetical protein
VAISWRSTPRSCASVNVGANAKGADALVPELRHLVGGLAAQDVHDVARCQS